MIQSPKGNILVVEDEESLQHAIRLNLELEGYDVSSAQDGAEAMKKMHEAYFDVVVLDIMMPVMDGLSVLENMRINKIDSHVLILSAKNTSQDRILGLRKGADDYLTKPFELEELLLRVSNLAVRSQSKQAVTASSENYSFGGHRIDFKALQAKLADGRTIELSKKEAMLLQLLTAHPNEVVTREKILQSVWGYQVFPATRTIDNFMLTFRKYFEEDSRQPRFFQSVRGIGYKFTP